MAQLDALCRVTLERPFRGGGAWFRWGTEPAIINPNYDPNRPNLGGTHFPGNPTRYPETGELIAGDPERDTTMMPLLSARGFFGDWMAPMQRRMGDYEGWLWQNEREAIIHRFSLNKYPASNGSLNPDMTVVGYNAVYPLVAIRVIDARGMVSKDELGAEIVVRPHEHFKLFDPATLQIVNEDQRARVSEQDALMQRLDALERTNAELIARLNNGGKRNVASVQGPA